MSDREEVVKKLEALDLSMYEDSHGRLSVICEIVSEPNCGWTLGACEGLRERLIYLLGGADDDADASEDGGRGVRAADGHADGDGQPPKTALMAEYHRGFVDGCNLRETATWQLDQERLVAVDRLRGIDVETGGFVKSLAEAVGVEWQASRVKQTIAEVRDRLIHLLSGNARVPYLSKSANMANKDGESVRKMTKIAEIGKSDVNGTSPNDDGTCPNDYPTPSITDGLRKWVKSLYTPNSDELKAEAYRIADRIDEQAKLLEHDVEMWRDRAEDMRMERDGLQAKLDEYDKTHVALPKDADGVPIHIGDTMHGTCPSGKYVCGEVSAIGDNKFWLLNVQFSLHPSYMRHYHEPTVEQVIRDLTLGKITESQAIERIEAL